MLFNVSHALEHALTERAQGDLAGLLAAAPQTASLVRLCADGSPDFATAAQARAADVPVGACMLVRPGEQVRAALCAPCMLLLCARTACMLHRWHEGRAGSATF